MFERRTIARMRWRAFLSDFGDRVRIALVVGAAAAVLSIPVSFVSWMREPSDSERFIAGNAVKALLLTEQSYREVPQDERDRLFDETIMLSKDGTHVIHQVLPEGTCEIIVDTFPNIRDAEPQDHEGVTCDTGTEILAADIRS